MAERSYNEQGGYPVSKGTVSHGMAWWLQTQEKPFADGDGDGDDAPAPAEEPSGPPRVTPAQAAERAARLPAALRGTLLDVAELPKALGKKGLGVRGVHKLTKANKLESDPSAVVFGMLDVNGAGFVEPAMLRELFRGLGYGELTGAELDLVASCSCGDDGKIREENIRALMER